MKKLKKGFTLVELVIVIAVIAVLAAVLIPTFSGIIQRSKVSNDTTIVKNLNTAMSGTSPETVSEAIDLATENSGYKISQLTATASGYNIVYDLSQNTFALLDGSNKVAYQDTSKTIDTTKLYNLWKVVQTNQTVNEKAFSVYLAGSDRTGTINISAGLEVGDNSNITTINYTNSDTAHNVSIYTNGGTLNINASSDTVKHYGTATTVNVLAVASNSYDEYGQVYGGIYVTKGHVVINSNQETDTAGTVVYVLSNNANVKVNDDTPVIFESGVTGATVKDKNDQAVTPTAETIIQTIANASDLTNAVANSGTYKLTSDINVVSGLKIAAGISVTIDLNGYKILTTSLGTDNALKDSVFVVSNGGELVINDSVGTGVISVNDLEGMCCAIKVTEKTTYDPTKTAKLTINGGKIIGDAYGVSGNGGRQNTEVNINGGYIQAFGETAVYNPQNGTLVITGGKIEGPTGIWVKSGELSAKSTFVGGTIIGNGAKIAYAWNGDGVNSTGDAVVIDYAEYPGGAPSASFDKVTLISQKGYQIGIYSKTPETGVASVQSTDNTLTLNTGFAWQETATVGVYKVVTQ